MRQPLVAQGLAIVARGACEAFVMHDQTKHRRERISRDLIPHATGLALYALTLAIELCSGAVVRWLAAYAVVAVAATLIPASPSASLAAWTVALAPLAWSLIALVAPGFGLASARRRGARRATAEEAEMLDDAFATLGGPAQASSAPRTWLVRDDARPTAAAIGTTVIVTRGLVDSDSLPCVIAHELGHIHSLDARLSEALSRLALWVDPLAASGGEGSLEPSGHRADLPVSIAARYAHRLVRIGGGATSQLALRAPWAAYWRRREYAADAYAASLGQAEELARHLAEEELPLDAPASRGVFDLAVHPPIALRVERLLEAVGLDAGER